MNYNFTKKERMSRRAFDIRPIKISGGFGPEKKQKTKIIYEAECKRLNKTEIKEKKLEERKISDTNFNSPYSKKYISGIKKIIFVSAKFAITATILFYLFNFIKEGLWIKGEGMISSQVAFTQLLVAKDSLQRGNFEDSYSQFNDAYKKLDQVSKKFDKMGLFLVDLTKYIPFLSKISSGQHLILAGKDFSEIGMLVSESFKEIEKIKSKDGPKDPISYLAIFQNSQENLNKAAKLLNNAQKNLESVNIDDIPEGERDKIIEIRKILPEINSVLEEFLSKHKLITDILGGNGPRKYLFLFQNNQEMRATGGFIGTYGILDIFNGKVRDFFIDGIFNPDGQLREKIVPPVPIQKISIAWSLHDSNWFPDFPKSAEKAAWFYEKTGGPTVDGVITITPTVIQKLLKIVGPIEMEDYELFISDGNFIEKIQQEIEFDYDKDLNQPKKILADLAPKILDKILKIDNLSDASRTANIFFESLNEKHILIYSKNQEVASFLSENGWSGEILKTDRDYLSVINTNINGFKTDGVISEKIFHKAEIQSDGAVIDTLTIERKHNGGDMAYNWWNKVNANYMRVYVPAGSRLISVEGHTREVNSSLLDYDALKFKRDKEIQIEENSIKIDENTGTRIYEDSGKTVFANWVYVSPKESVTVKYIYILPFKVEFGAGSNAIYSLLAQKQSGSFGSGFFSEITYPDSYEVLWRYPEKKDFGIKKLALEKSGIKIETDLAMNKFFGLAFSK